MADNQGAKISCDHLAKRFGTSMTDNQDADVSCDHFGKRLRQ